MERDGRGEAGGGERGKVGFGARRGSEAAHGEEHEQQEHRDAAEQAHLLADGGEDHIGCHDGNGVAAQAFADSHTEQASIGERVERLHNLEAHVLGVFERVEPYGYAHLHMAHDVVHTERAHGQEHEAYEHVGDAPRGNVEHDEEDRVKQQRAAQVAFECHHQKANAPHDEQGVQQANPRELDAEYGAVGDGEQLAVLCEVAR